MPAIGRQGALELFVPARGHDADDDESWHKLCESPCVVSVPVGARLRVNGDFRESAAFRAPDRASARLAVDPARSGVRALGIGLAAVGGAFALGGGYLYTQVEPYRPSDDNRNRVTQGDALGVGLFGLAVLGAGVGLASWHWRTRVTIDGGAQPGVPLAKGVWWTGSAIAF